MNYSVIRYILGWILKLEGAFMLIPFGISFIYRESNGVYLLLTAALCFALGFVFSWEKPKNSDFFAKEGFVTVSLSWIILSIMGALPFVFSGEIPRFTDALFETVSGFTTTGASILPVASALSHGMQFWRCFTHWIGGMGVLVFMLAVLPSAGGQNIYLMRAESPGPTVGKLVPRIQTTAKVLYGIYFGMTVIQFLLLLLAKMPAFDAICTTMGTAGTGGFGVQDDSIASYSPAIQNIVTVFMFLFGVNFNFYFLFLMKKFKDALCLEEVRAYFGLFLGASILITINLLSISGNFLQNFQQAAFQVSSVMTTTGFATTDFNQWPEFSKAILVLLMFCGACAGSTGGGIKISRLLIYIKSMRKDLERMVHPRSVKTLKMDGKAISKDVIHSTNIYLFIFFFLFAISVLIISLDGYDFTTNFTAVAATINNIGPGLELVGPASNYALFGDLSKYVLIFDMIVGRLEIFPMLVLLAPGTWMNRK
ncbi:MAG: TrkH family potassium uptake protein [Lachnospiraceae bacterium]|nr:TrkH family potassium uptake protein [Lachnospiraceae bacterium]